MLRRRRRDVIIAGNFKLTSAESYYGVLRLILSEARWLNVSFVTAFDRTMVMMMKKSRLVGRRWPVLEARRASILY